MDASAQAETLAWLATLPEAVAEVCEEDLVDLVDTLRDREFAATLTLRAGMDLARRLGVEALVPPAVLLPQLAAALLVLWESPEADKLSLGDLPLLSKLVHTLEASWEKAPEAKAIEEEVTAFAWEKKPEVLSTRLVAVLRRNDAVDYGAKKLMLHEIPHYVEIPRVPANNTSRAIAHDKSYMAFQASCRDSLRLVATTYREALDAKCAPVLMDRLESLFAMYAALDNSIQTFRLEQVDGKLLPHVKEGLVAKEELAELERNRKMERTFGRKGYKGTPRYSPFRLNNGRGKGQEPWRRQRERTEQAVVFS